VPTAARADDVDPLSRPAHRARGHVELPIELRVVVDADARFVRVHVRGENHARDHRLRVVFRTGVRDGRVLADAAFGPVARAPIVVGAEDAVAEQPPPTAPMHRWVSISNGEVAATIFADGLAEYEATPDGDVAITLLRAVGELSRPDLPERPGNAGWPVPTPEAQSLGPFAASFAVAFHAPHGAPGSAESVATLDGIECLADDFLTPLAGDTLRSATGELAPAGGLTLEGEGLAFSAAMPADEGEAIVLRCVNVTGATVTGAWRIRGPVARADAARLDGTPLEPLVVEREGNDAVVIRIVVPPRGVHTAVAHRDAAQ
jgi:alpha-mannosidase